MELQDFSKESLGKGWYYLHRFVHKNQEYEIDLEPCFNGYDVSLWTVFDDEPFDLVQPKHCINMDIGEIDMDNLMKNTPEAMTEALRVATAIKVEQLKA